MSFISNRIKTFVEQINTFLDEIPLFGTDNVGAMKKFFKILFYVSKVFFDWTWIVLIGFNFFSTLYLSSEERYKVELRKTVYWWFRIYIILVNIVFCSFFLFQIIRTNFVQQNLYPEDSDSDEDSDEAEDSA
jgi:hypothetical protein